jgi:hypothetical protein
VKDFIKTAQRGRESEHSVVAQTLRRSSDIEHRTQNCERFWDYPMRSSLKLEHPAENGT